jgi:hypothetical protein
MEEKYNKNHLEYFVVVEEKQRYIDEKERRGGNEKSVKSRNKCARQRAAKDGDTI